jgi:hypothetical protein
MTDPQRLLSGGGDEVELALLASARADAPSQEALKRAMLAVGIGGSLAAAATVASAAAVAKASMPPAAAAAAASKSSLVLLVKWVGIAALGGLAGWGVVHELTPAPQSLALAPVSDDAARRDFAFDKAPTSPPQAGPAVAGPTEDPATSALAGDEGHVAPEASRTKAPAAPRKPTLADEVAALDKARKAMDDDPEAALAAVESYEKGFKGGVLAEEAEMLRVESLARAGKKEEARAAAAAFLARYPKSAHAARIRALAP